MYIIIIIIIIIIIVVVVVKAHPISRLARAAHEQAAVYD